MARSQGLTMGRACQINATPALLALNISFNKLKECYNVGVKRENAVLSQINTCFMSIVFVISILRTHTHHEEFFLFGIMS